MAASASRPHVVTRIRTAEGKVLYARPADQLGQVIEPRNVAMMNAMMQETLLSGTARKAEIPGWMAAGKTGTSQDFRDAWFIGYTANLVTGVWLGNDDNSPTKKATGGGLPVEVWTRFMKAAHQGVAAVALPGSQGEWLASRTIAQAASQARAPAVSAPAPAQRRRPTGADANLGAPGSGPRTRRLADGAAVRTVDCCLVEIRPLAVTSRSPSAARSRWPGRRTPVPAPSAGSRQRG